MYIKPLKETSVSQFKDHSANWIQQQLFFFSKWSAVLIFFFHAAKFIHKKDVQFILNLYWSVWYFYVHICVLVYIPKLDFVINAWSVIKMRVCVWILTFHYLKLWKGINFLLWCVFSKVCSISLEVW